MQPCKWWFKLNKIFLLLFFSFDTDGELSPLISSSESDEALLSLDFSSLSPSKSYFSIDELSLLSTSSNTNLTLTSSFVGLPLEQERETGVQNLSPYYRLIQLQNQRNKPRGNYSAALTNFRVREVAAVRQKEKWIFDRLTALLSIIRYRPDCEIASCIPNSNDQVVVFSSETWYALN